MENQTPMGQAPAQETPVEQVSSVQETSEPINTEAKKTSVFTKWWFWLFILILILLVAFFLFDLTQDEEQIEQDETPATTEEFQETETRIPEETETVEEDEFVSWNDLGIPAVFPEYTYGDIAEDFFGFSWSAGAVPNFLYIYNTTQDDIRTYVSQAVEEGWNLDWEDEKMGDEESSWAISIEENDTVYSALLEYHIDETEEYVIMILSEGTVFD